MRRAERVTHYCRPEFISKEVFRAYMNKSRINKVGRVDGILMGSFVDRCQRDNKPIKSKKLNGFNVYRPIDVVARAKALSLKIEPTKEVALKQSIEEMERNLSHLEVQFDEKAHELSISKISRLKTGGSLLREHEIVLGASEITDLCGVYFLIHEKKIVYVGQSVNVFSRISSHLSEGLKKFSEYSFIGCERKQLDVLESLYIHYLRPKYNGLANNAKAMAAPVSINQLINNC